MNPELTTTLSERLKAETKSLHTEVERAGMMPAFLRGRIEPGAYCTMLRNLYEIYAALEDALTRHASNPRLAPILLPGLARSAALADDLQTLHGPDWTAQLPVFATTAGYRERLGKIARANPQLLAAHAYVRYLGDLSGGQILRRIVAEALQLAAGRGTRFYEFAEPGAGVLAGRFRAGLDALPLDPEGVDQLIAEARLGFRLHARLFEELAGE